MQQETGELFTDAHYYHAIIQPAGYNKQINLYLYSLLVLLYTLQGAYSIYASSKKSYFDSPEYFQKSQRAFATSYVTWLAKSQQELQHGMSLTGRPLYRNTHSHIFQGLSSCEIHHC